MADRAPEVRRLTGGYPRGVLAGRLDEAPPFTTLDGSTIREVAGRVSLPTTKQSLAEATVPAGSHTQAHFHRTSEELYVFTSGVGRIRVGDEQRDVRAGDCVVLPPGTEHKLWNTGDGPLTLLCCCAPPYAHEDTVITE
jgi:mannose-6-phosphate isomerase-like protein (cupin superfamily)